MCGIFGYIGNKNAAPILINGLKSLEYRGYDSAGIATIEGGKLTIIKRKGRVAILEKETVLRKINGHMGIAHTRWATHGEPNRTNAHPHTDCNGQIIIVHNGIIENYNALKDLLKKEGHKIISSTDSEIVAHLIEKFYRSNLEEAVIKALRLVEGAFGLAIMHISHNKIIAARRGSPLIIGLGKKEMFVSSDVPAILPYTKKVVYLEDNQIASITKNHYFIKSLNGKNIDNKIHNIKWSIDQLSKGRFEHFMLKEIFEQPESIENTMRGRLTDHKVKLNLNINVSAINKILITACGTSWHSALIGKHIIETISRVPVEVDYASEFRYRNPILNKKDLLIAISQSGETADTLAAIKEAKSKKIKTLGIINVVGSSISREVDCGIYLHAGNEVGVASTKAFTSQLIALLLFAFYLQQERGCALDAKILGELKRLPSKVKKTLALAKKIEKIAKKFKNSANFIYLGRGINFPVALEGALKLKEISYIHAEGYPAAEMKHGPIALVDKNMPVVFIATKDGFFNKILNNMQEIRARNGKIIAIVNKEDEKIKRLADYTIKVPHTINELSPVINIIPLQLMSYYIANAKGIDMDKPRNLAKSVTVE